MTDATEPAPERQCDLRIAAAHEIGFYVQEAGRVVACFEFRWQLAEWIERRLADVPGEREHEEHERRAYEMAHSNVEAMPRVARPRTEPKAERSWYGRRT